MVMLSNNQAVRKMHSSRDTDQRNGVGNGTGQTHHDRVKQASPLTRQVKQHRRFPMPGFQRMKSPQSKRQSKSQFVRVHLNLMISWQGIPPYQESDSVTGFALPENFFRMI